MNKVYLDCETTGLKPGNIGQLSIIIEDEHGKYIGKNYFFEVPFVNKDITEKFGRDVEYYKEKSQGLKFKDVADELFDMLNNQCIIAHNISFDMNFVSIEFWRCQKQITCGNQIDTMQMFKDIVRAVNTYGRIKNPKLIDVVEYFGINQDKALQFTKQVFNGDGDHEKIGFHDSRFDTACMFIAVQIGREIESGLSEMSNTWTSIFCDKR